jgi:peptide/nickel transport system permease protein
MLVHLTRRLLIGLLTLALVSFVVYGLIRAMPGDPISREGEGGAALAITAEDILRMRREFGLDRHWTLAYLEWAGKVLRADLGSSLVYHRPVAGVIAGYIGPTLLLSGVSLLLAYLISIPLGLYAARRSGKLDERALSAGLYALYSFPSYVLAIFLMLTLSVKLGLFPISGMRGAGHDSLSVTGKLLDVAHHMALPVACYTLGTLAYLTRFIRANVLEVYRQDFIRTARAKGLGEGAVLWRHAFRNALMPLVTLIGLSFPALLGGSVIIERIFAWPGMGRLFFEAIGGRDYPLIMGLTLLFSVLILAGNLLADVLYALVDPRVRAAG